MCTLVCRWQPDDAFPVQLLALRDELTSRAFDYPDAWWPDQPDVIGGRDRTAGGSWCVSSIGRGCSAVVLNRPERRSAAPGAPSRGMLPLLALRWGDDWTSRVQLAGMASFNLVLCSPGALRWWWFDGRRLERASLPVGTHVFTPSGLLPAGMNNPFAAGRARLAGPASDRTQPDRAATAQVWSDWLAVLRRSEPSADPGQLLVRTRVGDAAYETVFGQFIAAAPGSLRVDYLDHPARNLTADWVSLLWSRPAQAPTSALA